MRAHPAGHAAHGAVERPTPPHCSHEAGQVHVGREQEDEEREAHAEDDVEDAPARRDPGAVGALEAHKGQGQESDGQPQHGQALVAQEAESWYGGQSQGHDNDADSTVGLMACGPLRLLLAHGGSLVVLPRQVVRSIG